jgi:hypothetical protein
MRLSEPYHLAFLMKLGLKLNDQRLPFRKIKCLAIANIMHLISQLLLTLPNVLPSQTHDKLVFWFNVRVAYCAGYSFNTL